MSKLLTRVSMLLFGLFVAGGLAFGTTQAFGASSASVCDGFDQLGTCPGQFNEFTCNAACISTFGPPGGDCFMGCCNCIV